MSNMKSLNKNLAIVVLSCDKYADAWEPFFLMFQKYWPDCPFPIYLTSNQKKFQSSRIHIDIKQVLSNTFSSWGEETYITLNQIKEDYILLILEDFFIYQPVQTREIIEYFQIMLEENAVFMRLASFPKKYDEWWPSTFVTEKYSIVSIDAQYLICLQIAIWRKDFLLSIIEKSESPWEFEINGTKRSRAYALKYGYKFLSLNRNPKLNNVHGPITYFCSAITQGKWERDAIQLLKKNDIYIQSHVIKVKPLLQHVLHKIYISLPISIRKIWDFLKIKH